MSSVSPTMSSYSRRSNRRIPPRSATAPLPRGPPSPELSNLDCPFPPFPTSKSRSATPTRDLESKQSRSNHNEYVRMHAEPSPMYAPVSVRANGGGNVLQRMDTIAPGPFDVDSRDGQERSQGRGDGKQHKRTATVTSKDFSRPLSAGSVRSNFLRLSTVGAGNSQKPSLASISGGPRSMLDGEQQTPSFENLRGGPVRQDGHDSGFHRENLQQDPPDQPLRLEKRSQTFPVNSQTRGQLGQHIGAGTLQPSDLPPALRVRRPTISAASTPSLPEPFVNGEQSNSRSLPGNARPEAHRHGTGIQNRSISRDEPKMQRRPTEPPPALISNLAKEFREGNSQHTPTESISSTGSYGSDAKSGSSRSSPPLSDASTRLHTKPFNFDHLGNGGTDIPLSMDSSHLKDSITSRSKEAPRSNVKPPQERPGELLPQPDPRLEPPESPMDPAMQSGRLSPFPPSINHVPLPAQPKQRDLVPPPIRRATTSNKGNCRGCGEVIKGKSVSSADGRLTGRYHKQCFVCKTCREPFQTADFYVINNHPYCERHYHQLNGSLCRACDRGIEGQYLATESKQKFHPNCFTCQVRTHYHVNFCPQGNQLRHYLGLSHDP